MRDADLCFLSFFFSLFFVRPLHDDAHTCQQKQALPSSPAGLTVEVNNTDAEGRLVMADGCVFPFLFFFTCLSL